MKSAVVLLSGGLDSMVCAALAREAGFSVLALTVDYNQRHRVELEGGAGDRRRARRAAHRAAARPAGVRRVGADRRHRRAEGRRRRGHSGHLCAGAQHDLPQPRARPAPRRAARATSSSASTRSIIRAIPIAGRSSSPSSRSWPISRPRPGVEGERFTIHAPLQHMTKADIAREAQRLGLDAALSHSCYDPLPDGRHCGRCDACRLRAKGFAEAGIADPTVYA